MPPLRVYLDTSIFGGFFDPPFRPDSRRIIEAVRQGRLTALVSDLVFAELQSAPLQVQQVAASLPTRAIERIALDARVMQLQQAYLSAKILSPRWLDDAMHVAAATVAEADAIVSWNLRHIVRLDKIKAYNEVNVRLQYRALTIISPREVITDE